METVLDIREETIDDHDTIRDVNRRAFNADVEGWLVDRLRADGLVVASLVAVEAGTVVGHVLFSDLPIDTDTDTGIVPAVALAPMAVVPERQHRGIGSALVRRGLDLCRERGKTAVLVLGHPGFYPRFGFSPDLARSLRAPYSGDAFMALELVPGAVGNGTGTVRYPEAFRLVG